MARRTTPSTEAEQRRLDFESAEGTVAERKNLLGLALMRVRCDLHLAQFCLWVFNATDGGVIDEEVTRSYDELAASPWGLCCSRSKARSTAERARQLGLVACQERRYTTGAQRGNAYAVDWEGVRRILRLAPGANRSVVPPGHLACDASGDHRPEATADHERPAKVVPTDVATEHGGVSTEHGGALWKHLYKEETPLCTSLQEDPDPDPEGRSVPPVLEKELTEENTAAWWAAIPELATDGRPIAPLVARSLTYGVWAAIRPKHLEHPLMIVEWFRRQLGAPAPVLPPTERALLLALAAASLASTVAENRMRGNRVAFFVHLLSRRLFQRCLPEVPEARERLDRMLDRFGPALLDGTAWPPPAIEDRDPLATVQEACLACSSNVSEMFVIPKGQRST